MQPGAVVPAFDVLKDSIWQIGDLDRYGRPERPPHTTNLAWCGHRGRVGRPELDSPGRPELAPYLVVDLGRGLTDCLRRNRRRSVPPSRLFRTRREPLQVAQAAYRA